MSPTVRRLLAPTLVVVLLIVAAIIVLDRMQPERGGFTCVSPTWLCR